MSFCILRYIEVNHYDKQGPNILGFFLGIIQITLYITYKYCCSKVEKDFTHDKSSKDSKLEPVDDVIRDNQQIEMQAV